MKYKVLSLLAIGALLVTGFIGQGIDIKSNRYHQHLEAKEKTPCLDHGEEKFCTHLPLVNITTDGPMPSPHVLDEKGNFVYDELGNKLYNEEEVLATIEYFDNQRENNHLTDKPEVKEKGYTNIRGRSSRSFDKKGYAIEFVEEDLLKNKKVSLSGMVKDSDYVLHGPFLDKTLIRNYLCYNLAGEIMGYSPEVRFCELFLNGEYQGVYVLTEKVGYNDDGRVNITQTDPELNHTSYILRLDAGSEKFLYQLNTFTSYTGRNGPENRLSKQMEIIYPSKTLTVAQKEYIENDISKFEKALTSYDSSDKKLGYPSFIDVKAFVDYFIINEFTMNSDAGRLSTYYYKDIRGKLSIAVWDFNSAFDNYLPPMAEPHYFMMADKYWYEFLLKDKLFVKKIVARYSQLRKTFLSNEYMLNYIDEVVEYLGPAIDRNYEKWGYSFDKSQDLLIGEGRNPRSHEEAIQQLKNMVIERGVYLDKNISNLYAYSHDSINKKFKHVEGENN